MGDFLSSFTFDRNTLKSDDIASATAAHDHIRKASTGKALTKGEQNIVGALRSYLGVIDADNRSTVVGEKFLDLYSQNVGDAWAWLITRSLWLYVVPNGTAASINSQARKHEVSFGFFRLVVQLTSLLSAFPRAERFLYYEELCTVLKDDAAWSWSIDDLLVTILKLREGMRSQGTFPSVRHLLGDLEPQFCGPDKRDNINTVLNKAFSQTGMFEYAYSSQGAGSQTGIAIKTDLDEVLRRRMRFVIDTPVLYSGNSKEDWIQFLSDQVDDLPAHAVAYGTSPGRPKPVPSAHDAIPGGMIPLPKPFVLLAGISGTGKTRFVRRQAEMSWSSSPGAEGPPPNYELIPVRPDWHEPSDLLGYVSRISGERFVATPLLRFMAKSWRASVDTANESGFVLRPLDDIIPYWVCLDEMNLAPVEQYFADFLSIVETRKWESETYVCDPILRLDSLNLSDLAVDELRSQLGFTRDDGLWAHFLCHGMPLPPNLIIAGTVNMDETTHGFSRKVLDRAITIDFGVFFENDFKDYFEPKFRSVALTYPRWSKATMLDLAAVPADPTGEESIEFLAKINQVIAGTPFELAFRALNELLVSVLSFKPIDATMLRAVWDDFLMTKLLPRLEGDAEKMRLRGSESLLTDIQAKLVELFGSGDGRTRPDFFRTIDGESAETGFRTEVALKRMQSRLEAQNFTSFWP